MDSIAKEVVELVVSNSLKKSRRNYSDKIEDNLERVD